MSIMEDVKSLAKTIQQIDNIELYRKILDLQGEILNLVEENKKLKGEVGMLEEKFKIKKALNFREDAYWLKKNDGAEDGPFCSKCWDTQQQLVRLIFCGNHEYSECPNCKRPIKISREDKSENKKMT